MTLSWPMRGCAGILCLILTSLLAQTVGAAPVQGPDGRLASVLFPQSLAWQSVSELPQVPTAQITPRLKRELAAVTDECTAQMIKKPGWPSQATLRRASLFRPGEIDLIYTGISDCHEGDDTLIWRHVGEKSGLSEVGTSGRLLRIETTGDHRFILLSAACCAEVTDSYFIGQGFPHLLRSVSVLRTDYLPFTIPANAVPYPGRLILQRNESLSSAPRSLTTSEAAALETLHGLGAEPGMRTINAGTEVKTLLRTQDQGGRVWTLIEVERPIPPNGSDGRSTGRVTAGWIVNKP